MHKRKKQIIASLLALNICILGAGFTSKAVDVTIDYGPYRGVVSLSRYTSGGVQKVRNGVPVKCVIRLPFAGFQTYNATSKSVAFAGNQTSYTLYTRGTQIDIGSPKPYWVTVDIPGFR